MRFKLVKGKQKELILKAKGVKSWNSLAKILNINPHYLRNDLKNEKCLLSENFYFSLCRTSKLNFDEYIIEKKDDYWGRSLGGTNSEKRIKILRPVKVNEDLAEIFGIVLGDGHVQNYKKGKKVRCYSIVIAGNSLTDKDYMTKYIPNLFERCFGFGGSLIFSKKRKTVYYRMYGKALIDFIVSRGISSGNKKRNNQGMPLWIKQNKKYLLKCIRGLIDTDGSIHLISKSNRNPRICYTSYIPRLLSDVRNSLISLGFSPSKIIKDRQIFLTSKKDVNKYISEIGFSNQKNLNRLANFRNNAPIV